MRTIRCMYQGSSDTCESCPNYWECEYVWGYDG